MSGAQNRDDFTGGSLSTIGRRGDVEDTQSLCGASLDVRPSRDIRKGDVPIGRGGGVKLARRPPGVHLVPRLEMD